MSWGGETGSRLVAEWLVGAVTAIVALALFLPIALEWKALAVIVLVVEGGLLIMAQLGLGRRAAWAVKSWLRERKIRNYPELLADFYRLEKRIHRVLYERSSSHPSLRLQGTDAVAALSPPGNRSPLEVEFNEKVEIANRSYNPVHQRVEERSRGHQWKTLDFVYALREISNHLDQLPDVFSTAYRLAATIYRHRNEVPPVAWEAWETFRTEYNIVLQEWKAFTERFDQLIGYGTQTQRAEPVRSLR